MQMGCHQSRTECRQHYSNFRVRSNTHLGFAESASGDSAARIANLLHISLGRDEIVDQPPKRGILSRGVLINDDLGYQRRVPDPGI